MAFLLGGPVQDPQLDVSSELNPPDVDTPLPGVIEPNVQAVLDANRSTEPELPVEEPADGPAVAVGEPAAESPALAFASDEEALAFLQAGMDSPRATGPGVETPAEPADVTPAFASDEEALAFLKGAEAAKPLDISLGRTAELDKALAQKPVTTPEAADGTDVKFTGKDAAYRFTGAMVADPTTGQVQPTEGQIVFDQSTPERFVAGVDGAWQAGLLSGPQYAKLKENAAEVMRVVEERRKLEQKAQADPRLLAFLQGAGRGGAATLGAVGGAKLGAAAGLATGAAAPIASPVLGVAGAIGGGISAALGYDALYKQLGKHFEDYDNVMQAAELFPMHKTGGELSMAAVAVGTSVPQAVRGLQTAYQSGGVPQMVRSGATAMGLGAGTGAVAYPIDAAVRGEPITAGGLAAAAGGGALMGGFFFNNRAANAQDVAAAAAKMKAGQPLTAAESALVRAAQPAIRAELARFDASGGVRTGAPEVTVPTSSVAGLQPVAGTATARVPFSIPERLPASAVARVAQRRAEAEAVAVRPPVQSPEVIVPVSTSRPQLPVQSPPREVPVNVLEPGTESMTPMPAAMMEPMAYADAVGTARGIEEGWDAPSQEELMAEHFRIVREAVNNNEPVSTAALETYEMQVPYYVADEATGISQFDQATYDAWAGYVSGRTAEGREAQQEGGWELIEAIRKLGGLPSPKSGRKKAVWSGELKALWETARGGRDLGIKGVMNLFRNDAPDLDRLVLGLQQYGFRVDTEADLIELLDNRLRSGREVYGYGSLSEEPMPARMGRRPRGPAPAQMDLLGEQDVEFSLVGQTDRTSLTPEEMAAAQRAADERERAEALQTDLFGGVQQGARPPATAGAVSSDPLSPPPQLRSGGGAQVPPGQPAGAAPAQVPDWVLERGETSAGRRLIKGIENFQRGQRWGFRSIVDFVNDAVRLEMRRSTSQTTPMHPAHYRPANHVAFTRDTQSQINFHEAGHGLEAMIRAREPNFFNTHAAELIGLTQRPGSMASEPPSGASPAVKQDYKIGEGVAEWTRLLMVDPAAVANLKVTAAVSALAEQYYPGVAKALRDGARAVRAFQNKPVAERWAMFNAQPNVQPTANELVGALVRGGEAAVNALASGAPVSKLDRKIARLILQQRKEVGLSRDAALAKLRAVREANTTPLMSAYNSILSIGQEVQLAISGQGASKGLRVFGNDGKLQYFTKETWKDLRRKVPGKRLAQFDEAAWALESLNRWKQKGLEYPGMREGISPNDLELIVKLARRDIRNFDTLFAEQSAFHDSVLDLKDFGRLLKPGERDRIAGARDTYWPLPKVMVTGRGRAGKGGGDVQTGLYRAKGSGEAIRQIDEVTEERVRGAMEAYYWNRFGLMLVDKMSAVANDKSLPLDARRLAGASITKLNMPMKATASVSKEEALGWVMKAIEDAYEQVLGFRPKIEADDVNLSWNFKDVWRPVRPDDANVISLLRDGKREYYQLGDPAMFGMFASPQVATKAGRFLSWALGPMTQNWKRNITQGPVFAIRNFFRDIFTQTILNPDPIAWIPGGTHILGTINKFTQKYPQVFQEGLLLSRVQPGETELLNSLKHGAVYQWLTEGFYVSQSKNPVTKLLATVLQPSNWLFPLWKTADLFNLVTGGRAAAQFLETAGREGAAVSVLRRGGTDEEAMAKYWTAAGQFNEHAGLADARVVMNIPGFLNPMFQGVRNAAQKLSDPDPAVRGTAWTRLLVMMPLVFGGAAVTRYLFMSPEEKEKERQRPVDDRLGFMDIGGFSIPFPYGPEGVMGSVVYNAVMDDLLDRPAVDAERTGWMLLKRIADPGSPLQFFGPQLASMQEAQMNWSVFRQRHIVSPMMARLPASEQYYSTTPDFYRKLGQMFNYSPAKLQYVVQQGISRQLDETIRFMESMDRGRPLQEAADVPFVGRMFVRDPIGFSSQAVREVSGVEEKLMALDSRLRSKGWGSLVDMPADKLGSEDLKLLQMQLVYLQNLRRGLRVMDTMQSMGKAYNLGADYAGERNMRRLQTDYAQALLLANEDRIEQIDLAIELLQQIPQASPEQAAEDYLQRRF